MTTSLGILTAMSTTGTAAYTVLIISPEAVNDSNIGPWLLAALVGMAAFVALIVKWLMALHDRQAARAVDMHDANHKVLSELVLEIRTLNQHQTANAQLSTIEVRERLHALNNIRQDLATNHSILRSILAATGGVLVPPVAMKDAN